jgi:hypothetical protein
MRCSANGAKRILLSASIVLVSDSYSQNFELLTVKSAYYPAQEIEDPRSDGQIGIREWGVQLAIPHFIQKEDSTIVIHKIAYGDLRIDAEIGMAPSTTAATQRYQSISYNLGLIKGLGAHWLAVVNVQPTLASDFEEKLSGDDFLLQANALLINSKNEKFNYGFGLAYTTRVGRQIVLPMGLFTYTTRRLDVDIVVPNNLTITFKTPQKTMAYGIKAGIDGGVFNTTNNIAPLGVSIDKVGYSRLILAPTISAIFFTALRIQLLGGLAVGRRLELLDSQEEVIDWAPKNAPFVGLNLSLTPSTKKTQAPLFN